MTDVHEKLNRELQNLNDESLKEHARNLTLIKLIDEYCKARSLRPKTIETYQINIVGILKLFLKDQFGKEDITLPEITLQFLYRFEIFMLNYENPNRQNKKFKPGTAILYRQKIKAVIEYATDMLYYTQNPFVAWRDRKVIKRDQATEITRVLTPQQLEAFDKNIITRKDNWKLPRVRLLFLLQTWTGFSYSDLETQDIHKLIKTDNEGNKTIFYNRAKSGQMAILPLFPEAEKILEELKYDIKAGAYQAYFDLIKQLFTLYGLPKTDVGTHTGRHAFGERMLYMGFQMSDVSRMMGHNSILVTEKVYAKVDSTKIWSSYKRIQSANASSNPTPLE